MGEIFDLELYLALFNEVTSAIEELEKSGIITPQTTKALEILKNAQIVTEEMYIKMYINSNTKKDSE